MASKPIALVVEPRGKPIKKLPTETSVYLQASTSDLYHRLGAEAGISPDRIRVTKGSDGSLVPNAKDFTVERTGLRNKSVVYVKDLGMLHIRANPSERVLSRHRPTDRMADCLLD